MSINTDVIRPYFSVSDNGETMLNNTVSVQQALSQARAYGLNVTHTVSGTGVTCVVSGQGVNATVTDDWYDSATRKALGRAYQQLTAPSGRHGAGVESDAEVAAVLAHFGADLDNLDDLMRVAEVAVKVLNQCVEAAKQHA